MVQDFLNSHGSRILMKVGVCLQGVSNRAAKKVLRKYYRSLLNVMEEENYYTVVAVVPDFFISQCMLLETQGTLPTLVSIIRVFARLPFSQNV